MSYYEDRIYHDGYLDGYYASMELYHSDEMTDEEKIQKARRKRRRRNIALGIAGAAAGLLGGTYLYNEAKYNKELNKDLKAWRAAKNNANGAETRYKGPKFKEWSESFKAAHKPKRNIFGFRKTTGTYELPHTSYDWIPFDVERNRKLRNRKGFTKSKPRKTVQGFRRNPGTYRFDPNKDFGGFLTLQEMHRKARSRNYKHN